MHLIETLNFWDTQLFLFLNGLFTPFLDGFMYVVSAKLTWVPLYAAVLFLVVKHWKRESIWIILALVLCIVIADQIASGLLKGWIQRPRPSHQEDLKGLVHLVKGATGGLYGFVSSHAANSIGFALLTSLLFRNKIFSFVIFGWAILVSYSRISLGVHYPLDILGGAIVGVFAALVCYYAIKGLRPSLLQNQENNSSIEYKNVLLPIIIIGISFLSIIVYSLFFF